MPPRQLTARLALLLALAINTSLGATGTAVPEGRVLVEAALGDLQGDGWRAEGIVLALDSPQAGQASGEVRLARLVLPSPAGTLTAVVLRCGVLEYSRRRVRCRDAYLHPASGGQGFRLLDGDFDYRILEQTLTASGTAHHPALGEVRLEAQLAGTRWWFSAATLAMPLDALQQALTTKEPTNPLPLSGELDLRLRAEGKGQAYVAQFSGETRNVATSNAQGTLASDALRLTFSGKARADSTQGPIAFELTLKAAEGEAYVEPIYVNLREHAGALEAKGNLKGDTVDLHHLGLSLAKVITAQSDGTVRLQRDATLGRWRIAKLPLRFDPMVLPGAYQVLLQPFLAGTDLADLDTSGTIAGRTTIEDDQLRDTQVRLSDLHAEDRAGHLAVYGLSGEVDRLGDGRLQPHWLAFDGGFVYGISFGAQRVDFAERNDGRGWRLAAPVDVPVLDGQLHLERLDFAPGAQASSPPTIALDARLRGLGMRAISRAFGWPALAGTLSGRIPSVTYENGDIAIAGTLEAEVFGGNIAITGLRVREPFGNRAIARANVDWRQLDLEALSSTFSFGRMNGRVDGYLHDLVLLNWAPLRFDAALFTSPGDRSRHRISQRAVDSLTSLGGGGGAGAALSSSFLRFFEDFAYDELRLGCRLEEGVCEMSGLSEVIDDSGEAGYLILRGRGIPRLSVVGHSQRVDWPRFLAQLKSVTASGGEVSVER